MIGEMVSHDYQEAQKSRLLIDSGFQLSDPRE